MEPQLTINRFTFPLSAPISRRRFVSVPPFLCSRRTEFRLRSRTSSLSLSRGSRAWGGLDQRAQIGKNLPTNTARNDLFLPRFLVASTVDPRVLSSLCSRLLLESALAYTFTLEQPSAASFYCAPHCSTVRERMSSGIDGRQERIG